MRRYFTYLTCFALCAGLQPFGLATAWAQPAPGTVDFDPTNPPTQTMVMRGETLFNIAERTRSPLQALIRANNLKPPYIISPGQVLALPPLKVHVVAPNETFSAIARRYSVDERSLAVFNRLTRPVKLSVQQRIILPPFVTDRFTGLEPQDLLDLLANEIEAGRQVTGAIPGQIIANSEASSPSSPPVPIPQQPPVLRPAGPSADGSGDVITAQTAQQATIMGPTEDGDGTPTRPRLPTAKARSPTAQTASLLPPPATRPRVPSTLPSLSDAPPLGVAGGYIWPVMGRVVETFGAKRDFRTYDGIEIEAAAGSPFKAMAGGTVAYVGNQLPGYGWLILIRHPDGIMSAYAYAQSVNVRENQIVTRGQVIGLVGTTGRAATPRLHFQIRQNTRPVDPLARLPKIRAAA